MGAKIKGKWCTGVALAVALLPSTIAFNFTQPSSASVFSSTAPNTLLWSTTSNDPTVIDLYLSFNNSLVTSSQSRLLASGVSTTLGSLTFQANAHSLPPGVGYSFIAVPKGTSIVTARSTSFTVVLGTGAANGPAGSSSSSATKTSTKSSGSRSSTTKTTSSALSSTSSSSAINPDETLTPAVAPGSSAEQHVNLGGVGQLAPFRLGWVSAVAIGVAGALWLGI